MNLSSLVIPGLLAGVAVYGMGRRVDVYGALTTGARDGLTVMLNILPPLVGLLTAVAMFRASGAMEWLTGLCAPVMELLGIPAELTPLMLIRPVSGGGALAVGSELITTYGVEGGLGAAQHHRRHPADVAVWPVGGDELAAHRQCPAAGHGTDQHQGR